jgi:hypothetical protein
LQTAHLLGGQIGRITSTLNTKGEYKMNLVQIREELKALTNSDASIVDDISFALNLIATNNTLTKAIEENVIVVANVAKELQFLLSE